MKIQYSPDADVLMLILKDDPPVNAIAEPGGIIVSYGESGEPVTVEFLNASQRDIFQPSDSYLRVETS